MLMALRMRGLDFFFARSLLPYPLIGEVVRSWELPQTHSMDMFFLWTLGLILVLTSTKGEECNSERLKRCRYVVQEELQRRSTGLSHKELQFHCKAIRQNLDCIIFQVTMCNSLDDRERSSDVIWKAWKYLQSVCDSLGGWWQSRCYQRDDVKQCERLFSIEGTSFSRTSCSNYLRFRDCVTDIAKRRCEPEDGQLLGSYLLDKAQEMVWRCPGTSQISYTYNTAALTSDTTSLTGCNARASTEIRGCLDRYQFQREESQGWKDSEERLRRSCCATWNYKRCVRENIKNYCFDAKEIEVTNILNRVGYEQEYLCREQWVYTCTNGCLGRTAEFFLVLSLSVVSFVVLRYI